MKKPREPLLFSQHQAAAQCLRDMHGWAGCLHYATTVAYGPRCREAHWAASLQRLIDELRLSLSERVVAEHSYDEMVSRLYALPPEARFVYSSKPAVKKPTAEKPAPGQKLPARSLEPEVEKPRSGKPKGEPHVS